MVAKNPRSGAKKFYSETRGYARQIRAGYGLTKAPVK
jgi:hypothetical protein